MTSPLVSPDEEAVLPASLPLFSTPAATRRGWKAQLATVRGKTIIIVVATCVCLLLILYGALRVFLLGSFVALENQAMRVDVARVTNTLTDTLQGIATLNQSYAVWDDTYAFVQDHDSAYIEANWYDAYFSEARFNLVVITDSSGQVVFSKAFDFNNNTPLAVPERFRQLAPTDALLQTQTLTTTLTGIVLLPDHPMLIASHPILTSKGDGPSRGTLLIGRYLDAAEITRLSRVTNVSLDVLRSDQMTSSAVPPPPGGMPKNGETIIHPVSADSISGSTYIADVDGNAGIVLRVQAPRTIYQQGEIGIRYFLVALLVAGVVFGIVILVLLERVVLVRVSQLTEGVQAIGSQSDLSARVTVAGNDELAMLSTTVNEMLAALDHAQHERQQTIAAREHLRVQEETIQAKRAFLTMVSHELRTPLTPIRGFVDLLLRNSKNLTDDQVTALSKVKSSAMRMTVLIEDLLDMGQVEAHRVTLTLAPVDIRVVIADTLQLLEPAWTDKQITVEQDIAPDIPLIDADQKRMGQIVTNLLSNAIKYTYPQGTIWVTASMSTKDTLEIQVKDTGVGLTPEQQHQLFTPFYRADHALRDHEMGTGLGLSIVKSFVELHHGRIWVESEPGVGSTFKVTLPVTQQGTIPEATPSDG